MSQPLSLQAGGFASKYFSNYGIKAVGTISNQDSETDRAVTFTSETSLGAEFPKTNSYNTMILEGAEKFKVGFGSNQKGVFANVYGQAKFGTTSDVTNIKNQTPTLGFVGHEEGAKLGYRFFDGSKCYRNEVPTCIEVAATATNSKYGKGLTVFDNQRAGLEITGRRGNSSVSIEGGLLKTPESKKLAQYLGASIKLSF